MVLSFLSPAKVNLFFRVLKRRSDGFHEIVSLNQTISLYDLLTFSIAKSDCLTCDASFLPVNETNLVWKAVKLFRAKTGWEMPLHIHLEKRIPVEAGLGGGSGNAATTLWALTQLSELEIDEEILREWIAEISSDAPFFFSSGTAYCEGRGEKITSIEGLPALGLYLAKPKEGLSTPLVYRHCIVESFKARDPVQVLMKALQGELELFNDLEQPAFDLMPMLNRYKEELLERGCSEVVMTGSGTALMCLGVKKPMVHPELTITPVRFIQRFEGKWYD